MRKILTTTALEKHLIARGLVPDGCRLLELSITPNSALVVRYEVFIDLDRLELFADAMKATAVEAREPLTPGCDCEQMNNPDPEYHASDCEWRMSTTTPKNSQK